MGPSTDIVNAVYMWDTVLKVDVIIRRLKEGFLLGTPGTQSSFHLEFYSECTHIMQCGAFRTEDLNMCCLPP